MYTKRISQVFLAALSLGSVARAAWPQNVEQAVAEMMEYLEERQVLEERQLTVGLTIGGSQTAAATSTTAVTSTTVTTGGGGATTTPGGPPTSTTSSAQGPPTSSTPRTSAAPPSTTSTTSQQPVTQTLVTVITTTNSDGSPTSFTSATTATTTPGLSQDNSGGTSSMSPQTRNIVIGVVVGVGGAIILAALGLLAWRIWGRKKPVDDSDDLIGYGGEGKSEVGSSAGGTANSRTPFQSTLESYHAPTQANPAANF